jgi:NAD(P)-dependent dehydrogenase (short-subunit alcohol dehydrogenase family)|tara:strand:- start:18102 stop:18257 length:156 start_codon:yes stop_codon:yes gene_type:complete
VVEKIILVGGSAFAVQADISIETDVKTLFEAIDQKCGRLDVLVHNAGILFG